ncbi:WD40 repeat-like protein [Nadsonia fulvescens var. elongata DSM 6958]|uniref:WD40 repeat-like protein n=1 Tax=Nadsonia fulvescens var. elongata DSM 6958 TaxID=857566 RepID=A0A1E3PJ80_9ASCO|nr:WD40 repeat-like protein [Nadsonia fulvescens var. elongata DSM 6958]
MNRYSTAVPTDDAAVRAKLRRFGEPITYFGEDNFDRRARLASLLGEAVDDSLTREEDVDMDVDGLEGSEEENEEEEEEFYTPGDETLLMARHDIARFSLQRARQRLDGQRASFHSNSDDAELVKTILSRRSTIERLAHYNLYGSQVASTRAVSMVRYTSDGDWLASGDWDGRVSVWDPHLSCKRVITCHDAKITGLDWSPLMNKGERLFATGGNDNLVKVWSFHDDAESTEISDCSHENIPRCIFTHDSRVARVAFHPSGRYLASASFDTTWRLWDLTRETELLLQEGHAKEVFALAMHPDGALVGSGGLDAIGRIWDIRSGKTIMILDSHIREIYGLDFAPCGVEVVTAAGDGQVKVWDLRMVREKFSIPAHNKIASDVRFFRASNISTKGQSSDGSYFCTSSYDGTVKVWNSDTWTHIKTLQGGLDRVMSVDVSPHNNAVASAGWDRNVKLWAEE